MVHLHIRTSGEANSKVNNERTNHIFALSFVASFASPFVVLAFEVVFPTRVKGDKQFIRVTCSYACENNSFAQRQRHTNVRASDETRHEHECVNVVLHITGKYNRQQAGISYQTTEHVTHRPVYTQRVSLVQAFAKVINFECVASKT